MGYVRIITTNPNTNDINVVEIATVSIGAAARL